MQAYTLYLPGGETNLYSAVIDTAAGYAYFGTNTIAGQVVKVGLERVEATATPTATPTPTRAPYEHVLPLCVYNAP
jgi:hypothetical protein